MWAILDWKGKKEVLRLGGYKWTRILFCNYVESDPAINRNVDETWLSRDSLSEYMHNILWKIDCMWRECENNNELNCIYESYEEYFSLNVYVVLHDNPNILICKI